MKYVRYDNVFSPAPGDFMVRAIDVPTADEAELCEEVASFNEGMTAEQAALAARLFDKALRNFIRRGSNVKTRFAEYRLGAKGHIDQDGKKAVKANVHLLTPKDYAALAAGNQMEEVPAGTTGPTLFSIKDSATDLVDAGLSPGGAAVLLGRGIKVESGCVRLRNVDTGAVTEISGGFPENKPGTVIFMVPANIAPGTYRVGVVTCYNGSKPYATPKSTELDIDLPVPPSPFADAGE